MTYYKTTLKAKSQDDIILALFKNNTGAKLSASEVLRITELDCPLTSVRRSINTLANQGHLVKLDQIVEGMYGRPERLWTIKKLLLF